MAVPYTKILLPLDGSEIARRALPHAETIAGNQGATLILFRVVEDPVRLSVTPPNMSVPGPMETGEIGMGSYPAGKISHVQAMDEAQRSVEELATSLKHRKIDAFADIDTGDPAECIVDYAGEQGIDLIVMSTHGRTGVGRWTYGSVANKVLQVAPCPVLVVRPPVPK